MSAPPMTEGRQELGDLASRWSRFGFLAAIAGVGLAVLLWLMTDAVDSSRFLRSYLMAFIFVLSLSLGGLFFTLVQHLVRAGWSVVVRRIAEAAAANLSWMGLLFLPIFGVVLFGQGGLLFDWLDPAHQDEIMAGKAPYLNKGFWVLRAVVFFAVWATLGRFYFRTSVAQDASGEVSFTHRMQRLAPIGMILFAVTQTFAIIDWGMALEAHWFSTMYGVYFFAASCCGFFSFQILAVYLLQRNGRIEHEVTLEHYQDMGKQLFAFGVVFWAYIAFSQYMLIWYANIPEETGWYIARQLGGWLGISALLLVGHFVAPFLLLVTKHTKRVKPVLAAIAAWLILMHAVDIYWLIMPKVPAAEIAAATGFVELLETIRDDGVDIGFRPHLVDLALLVGLFGFYVAMLARRLRGCALVPIQDPRLPESLAFENM